MDKYNPVYGGVTFKEYEAACKTETEYLMGLAGTVQIRDMIKDEVRKDLERDAMMAGLVDMALDGARRRFIEAVKELHKDLKKKAEAEKIEKEIAECKETTETL